MKEDQKIFAACPGCGADLGETLRAVLKDIPLSDVRSDPAADHVAEQVGDCEMGGGHPQMDKIPFEPCPIPKSEVISRYSVHPICWVEILFCCGCNQTITAKRLRDADLIPV